MRTESKLPPQFLRALATLIFATAPVAAFAHGKPQRPPQLSPAKPATLIGSCEGLLAQLTGLPNTAITGSTTVAAGALQVAGQPVAEHCRVTGRMNDVTHKVTQVAAGLQKQATGTWDKLEGVFESRVERALKRLSVPTNREINALAKRVEELGRSMAAATKAKPARKAPAKRAKTAKKAAKRAAA